MQKRTNYLQSYLYTNSNLMLDLRHINGNIFLIFGRLNVPKVNVCRHECVCVCACDQSGWKFDEGFGGEKKWDFKVPSVVFHPASLHPWFTNRIILCFCCSHAPKQTLQTSLSEHLTLTLWAGCWNTHTIQTYTHTTVLFCILLYLYNLLTTLKNASMYINISYISL